MSIENNFTEEMLDVDLQRRQHEYENAQPQTNQKKEKKIMEQKNNNREQLKKMYFEYELTPEDVFKHQHYVILTRSGIEKIMAKSNIDFKFEVIKCESNFAAVKAISKKGDETMETFGSAIKGASYKDGNTNSWYVLEMAEKRALARAVLKLLNLYEIGVKSEDESDSFVK